MKLAITEDGCFSQHGNYKERFMDIDRKQKDKLLKWLCKKCKIIDLFFGEANDLRFHFIFNEKLLTNFALIEEVYAGIKKKNDDDHILDLLLDISSKGYAISNCVKRSDYYIKIMEPYCSYEQLAIEADLDCASLI